MMQKHDNIEDFVATVEKSRHSIFKLGRLYPTQRVLTIRLTCIVWPTTKRAADVDNPRQEGTIHHYDATYETVEYEDNPFAWVASGAWVESKVKLHKAQMEMFGYVVGDGMWTEEDLVRNPWNKP
jgi:hypothetical protein